MRDVDDSIPPGEALRKLSALCRSVVNAQPSMVQIFNLANDILLEAERYGTTGEIVSGSIAFLERERFRDADKIDTLSEHLKDIYFEGMRILVHSHSSTVNQALSRASDRGCIFSVVVTEGRPMLEGRLTAKELASHGIPVSLICDTAAASEMADVDMVLLGADGVALQGVINKVGSLAITLAARHHSVPVYVLATRSKFFPSKAGRVPFVSQDPSEVWASPPAGVSINNVYYEYIPLDMVSLLTEDGVNEKDEVVNILGELPVSALMPIPEDMV